MKNASKLNKIIYSLLKGGPGSGGAREGAGRPAGSKEGLTKVSERTDEVLGASVTTTRYEDRDGNDVFHEEWHNEPTSMKLVEKNVNDWTRGVDYDAKVAAYETMSEDVNRLTGERALEISAIQDYSKSTHFGVDYRERLLEPTSLYRVGPADEGVSSFFTERSAAESYQKRMGVSSIQEYSAKLRDIYPVLTGAGEVWVHSDNFK